MRRSFALGVALAALLAGACDRSATTAQDAFRDEVIDDEPQGGGGGFLPPPPDLPASAPCDTGSQDCPAGEKCTWYFSSIGANPATRCVAIEPDAGKIGATCALIGSNGRDTCERGATCFHVDPKTELGTCVEYPTGTPDGPLCPDPFTVPRFSAVGGAWCLSQCNPLSQDCATGQGCYPSVGTGLACSSDASGSGGMAGDPCAFENVCAPGFFCLAPEATPDCDGGDGCCSPVCDLSAPLCPVGQSCTPWYEADAPPGMEDVGVCSA